MNSGPAGCRGLAIFLQSLPKRIAMKMRLPVILSIAALVLCASTCEKMEPGDYHDYLGNKINILGGWTLSEVRYKTAGVIETHPCEPQTVMEFALKGRGYTKTLAGDILDTWHYETYRAAVTIFTEAEWENNRGLGEDDSNYEKGNTYYFHVIDGDTISSEEKVSSNSTVVNIYTRFHGLFQIKAPAEDMFSPDRLLIMYDEAVGKEPILKAVQEYGAELLYDYSIIPGIAIRIPEGADIHQAIAWFKKVEGVVSVERDQIIRLTDPVRPRLEVM